MKNRKSKTNDKNFSEEEFEITPDGEIIEMYNTVIDTDKKNQYIDGWYISHTSDGSISWEIKHYNVT